MSAEYRVALLLWHQHGVELIDGNILRCGRCKIDWPWPVLPQGGRNYAAMQCPYNCRRSGRRGVSR